jgi:hypothetical protein
VWLSFQHFRCYVIRSTDATYLLWSLYSERGNSIHWKLWNRTRNERGLSSKLLFCATRCVSFRDYICSRSIDAREDLVVLLGILTEAKIGEFDVPMLVDEDVVWFEVSVNDSTQV